MRRDAAPFFLAPVVLALACLADTSAAQYHDPIYLVGGRMPTTTTLLHTGIWMLDNRWSQATLVKLGQPGYTCRFWMDRNNRDLLVSVQGTYTISTLYAGPRSGLFRFDIVSRTFTTIHAHPTNPSTGFWAYHHAIIDHNGDYICGVYHYDRLNSRNSASYLFKIDPAGRLSTLISSATLGVRPYLVGDLTVNIDTGKVLVNDLAEYRSSIRARYMVFEVDTDTGSVTTWCPARHYGWYGYYCMPQSHRNGFIEGAYTRYVYQLRPGAATRRTLATLTGLPYSLYGAGAFDLQTAARPRQIYCGYTVTGPVQTYLYHLDASNWAVTSVGISPGRTVCYGFDFYRGRHTQAIRTAPRTWTILLSAPSFPGRSYVVAAGISGVRPGVRLRDGRNLNLNPDRVTALTALNRIRPVWDSGPGVLDARGTARAKLDLSWLARLDVPLWIAWLVLDPRAPAGIACVPDTYVMRI